MRKKAAEAQRKKAGERNDKGIEEHGSSFLELVHSRARALGEVVVLACIANMLKVYAPDEILSSAMSKYDSADGLLFGTSR